MSRNGPPVRDVQLVDYGIRGMHLAYDLLEGCDALVLVDAMPNRGAPGTLHVFEADHESLSPQRVSMHTHGPGCSVREPERVRRHTAVHDRDRLRSREHRRGHRVCPTRWPPRCPKRCAAIKDVLATCGSARRTGREG